MKKIKGDIIRREREKRAWTQEELSERTRLGVRTLRRLEAGQGGSLETIRRVAEALDLSPEATLTTEPKDDRRRVHADWLYVDPVMVVVGSAWIEHIPAFIERVGSVRRHVAQQLGFLAPGVRLRDDLELPPGGYRIMIRGLTAARGEIVPGRVLALGQAPQLARVTGHPCADPTYGMPGVWIELAHQLQAEEAGCMIFSPVTVLATHLTEVVRANAWRLLGIDEVHYLLELLEPRKLVAEVIPSRVSVITLRAVLRELLRERVSIRDLPLVLETLADQAAAGVTVEELVERVREALGESICLDVANDDGEILAVLDDGGDLRAPLDRMATGGVLPLVVTKSARRRALRQELGCVVLAESEIPRGLRLVPWREP